jgi:hypothetical protein
MSSIFQHLQRDKYGDGGIYILLTALSSGEKVYLKSAWL